MKSNQAQAAKLIRQELKQSFPGVKFEVSSNRYAGGSSVDVYYYSNEFLGESIHKITDKYQYGHFDGMTDSYEMSNKRNDLPQVQFVLVHQQKVI